MYVLGVGLDDFGGQLVVVDRQAGFPPCVGGLMGGNLLENEVGEVCAVRVRLARRRCAVPAVLQQVVLVLGHEAIESLEISGIDFGFCVRRLVLVGPDIVVLAVGIGLIVVFIAL